ncbi:MAG: type II secretion system F family protein [Pseudonocardiaceae bacterium]
MTTTVLLAAVLGAGTGTGLWLLTRGLGRPGTATSTPDGAVFGPTSRRDGARLRMRTVRRWLVEHRPGQARRLGMCLAVGLLAGVATRWPVAAILAGYAAWVLPALVGPDRDHKQRLARIEAIATWTESLRDTLGAAAGLEQAIMATAVTAPQPIRDEIRRLAGRLQRGDRLPQALRDVAADLDDATADLVVAALVMAAERHARHIGELLSSLATAARDQASLRMRVMAGRARVRTASRVIVTVTVVMATGLVLANRGYLAPYDGLTGQLVLLAVGGCFGFGIAWLSRISRISEPDRVLNPASLDERAQGVLP